MGMKEDHEIPKNPEERIAYMRNETYFNGLKEGNVDELRGNVYLHANNNEKTQESVVQIVPIKSLSNIKPTTPDYEVVMLDLLHENDSLKGYGSLAFLFSLYYKSNEIYQWRKNSWEFSRKKGKRNDLVDTILGKWLFPNKKPTPLNMPNLFLRISGEWKGWENTPNIDSKNKRYNIWNKNDEAEDKAFEIYKKIVHPLAPMIAFKSITPW